MYPSSTSLAVGVSARGCVPNHRLTACALTLLGVLTASQLDAARLSATPPASAEESTTLTVNVTLTGGTNSRTRYEVSGTFAGTAVNVTTNPDGVSFVVTFAATPLGLQTLTLKLYETDLNEEQQILDDMQQLQDDIADWQADIAQWEAEIDAWEAEMATLGNTFWDRIRRRMLERAIERNEDRIADAQDSIAQAEDDLSELQDDLDNLARLRDTKNYTIDVVAPPPPPLPPTAPEFAVVSELNAVVGQTLTTTFTATDPNAGDMVTYSGSFYVSGEEHMLEPQAYLDPVTGDFTYTPASNQVGDRELVLFAVDSTELYSSMTVVVHVLFAAPGTFVSAPFGPGNDTTAALAAGDVNGDGFVDLVTGNISGRNYVYLNDGSGNFTQGADLGAADFTFTIAEIGDLNGDSYPDVAVARFGRVNTVHFNDGMGNFPVSANFAGSATRSVALADMDNDGDNDLVVANDNGQGANVLLNNGSGAFPTAYNLSVGDHPSGVAVADLNGDGLRDVVTVDQGGQNKVHLNTGSGFTASTFGPGNDSSQSVACADMNGDGSMDIVVGNNTSNNNRCAVYFNNGSGGFLVSGFEFGVAMNTFALKTSDMDNDGDSDVVVANYSQQNVIFYNDGSGNLLTSMGLGTASDNSRALALADFDNDGRTDVAVGNNGAVNGQNWVWFNR